jgi:hypothetical protein
MKNGRVCSAVLLVLVLAACKGGSMVETTLMLRRLDSVEPARLERLIRSRLFFGHQSVGFNIIEGLGDVLREKGGQGFAFVEGRRAPLASEPVFLHATIGENGESLAKIRDFESVIRGLAEGVDIAFMKLCYADLWMDTDVQLIFASYKDALARLKADRPDTIFVHWTVPLVAREGGLKPFVKRLLGRAVAGYEDNLNRERLNELLRAEYGGKEPLFDLALFESTRPDGSRSGFPVKGKTCYALEPAYTDDGGHLNEKGRRFIAEQLLVFLAEIAR